MIPAKILVTFCQKLNKSNFLTTILTSVTYVDSNGTLSPIFDVFVTV